MQNNRQLAINIISSIVVYIVQFSISFILTPYIVKKLGVAAYGFVGLSNNIIGYTSLITIALNSMAGRFITIEYHKGNFNKANTYFSTVFFSNICVSSVLLLLTVAMIFFLEQIINIPNSLIGDVKLLFFLLALNSVVGIITGGFGVATFVKNRLELSSIRTLISSLIRVAVLVICFGCLTPHVWYIGLSGLICSCYLVVANIKFMRDLTPELMIHRVFFKVAAIKSLVSAGIWNVVSRLSSILNRGLDLLLANLFISATAMGMLSVSLTIPFTLLSICASIAACFAPDFTRLYAINDMESLKNEFLKSIRIMAFFSSIPISIVFIFGEMFYELWIPNQDCHMLYMLTLAASIEMPLAMPQESLWNIFTITNQVKKSSLNLMLYSIIGILFILICMFFVDDNITRLFILASTRSITGIIRLLTFLPIQGAKCLNFDKWIFYPAIFKSLVNIVVICLIGFIIKNFIEGNSWSILILLSLATSICGIIVNFYISLTSTDRVYLLSWLKSKLKMA